MGVKERFFVAWYRLLAVFLGVIGMAATKEQLLEAVNAFVDADTAYDGQTAVVLEKSSTRAAAEADEATAKEEQARLFEDKVAKLEAMKVIANDL